jgi:hypothetical protein
MISKDLASSRWKWSNGLKIRRFEKPWRFMLLDD